MPEIARNYPSWNNYTLRASNSRETKAHKHISTGNILTCPIPFFSPKCIQTHHEPNILKTNMEALIERGMTNNGALKTYNRMIFKHCMTVLKRDFNIGLDTEQLPTHYSNDFIEYSYLQFTLLRQPHTEGFTMPSSAHPYRNEDFQLHFNDSNGYNVTITCDGVSHSGIRGSKTINGYAASRTVAKTMYEYLTKTAYETTKKTLLDITENLDNQANLRTIFSDQYRSNLEREAAEATLQITQKTGEEKLEELRGSLFDISDAISIDPPKSATTLEIAFQIKNATGNTYLFTYSCGDSATVVYDQTKNTIHQMNPLMRGYVQKSEPKFFDYDNLKKFLIKSLPPKFPGSTITNDLAQDGKLIYKKVNRGDKIITFTDGIGDGISEVQTTSEKKIETTLDEACLIYLINYATQCCYSDRKLEKFIAYVAAIMSPKIDDITIHVSTVD